jgi:hypothetical protein
VIQTRKFLYLKARNGARPGTGGDLKQKEAAFQFDHAYKLPPSAGGISPGQANGAVGGGSTEMKRMVLAGWLGTPAIGVGLGYRDL